MAQAEAHSGVQSVAQAEAHSGVQSVAQAEAESGAQSVSQAGHSQWHMLRHSQEHRQ